MSEDVLCDLEDDCGDGSDENPEYTDNNELSLDKLSELDNIKPEYFQYWKTYYHIDNNYCLIV